MGLIEKYGSGIGRIINCFKIENSKFPIFQNISDGFMVTIFSIRVAGTLADQVNVLKDVPKDVPKEDRTITLLALMKEFPNITMDELAQKGHVNVKTIKRDIERLKSENRVKRVAGRKNGRWEVNLFNS